MAAGRKLWLDALRAVAIMFVVMGHQLQWWGEFFIITTPIKIPLFFAISGYLFNDRGGNAGSFFAGLFRRLIFPYFCLVTIPAALYALYYGFGVLGDSWYKMISGESYWFMTCIIVAESVHFIIRKYIKPLWAIGLSSLTCAVVGLVLSSRGIMNFATVNTALICQFYLYLGNLLKEYETYWSQITVFGALSLFVFYVLLCFAAGYLFDDCSFDCHLNQYYSVPYCWMLITLGCTVCFMLAKHVNNFPGWLLYIGKNTLILYLWAGHTLLLFTVLGKFGVYIPERSILMGFIQSVYICGVCMGAAWFVNRFMPRILGR